MSEKPRDSTSGAKSLAASFASRGKAAALLVAKQTERTKVTMMDLAGAYQALGRHVYTSTSYRADFADLYQKVETLLQEVATLEILPASWPKAAGFLGKAKAAAQSAKHAAQLKGLQLKASHALADLGKTVLDRFGPQGGPEELTRPIADCLTRLQAIDAEIGKLSQTTWG